MNRGSARAKATAPPAAASACKSDFVQTLFGTTLLVVAVHMMCWTPLACTAAAPPPPPPSSVMVAQGERRSVNRTVVRCLPVAHDVLWKRLRLVVSDFDNFRTTDNNDEVSSEIGNFSTSTNNDTSEPRELSAPPGDGLDQRATTPPDRLVSDNERKSPETLETTLPSEESNRIPDDTRTHSPKRQDHQEDPPPRLNRLLKNRRVRRLRRNQRQQLRRRKLMTAIFRKTSWHCHMSKYWKRMPPGLFPPYVQTARCRQHTCMMGMFECRPRRYRIKLLRRNDGVCNPLPTIAAQTDYEETWTFVEFKVVVGCECSRRYEAGSYSRHNRTSAGRRHLEDANNS